MTVFSMILDSLDRPFTRPGLGIIEPCLPSPAKAPPSGPGWLREIKHDGFRILARRDAAGVRLITRAGNDFSSRFPFIAIAVSKLPARSCLIDGEAFVCDENGLAVFDLIRGHGSKASAVLRAFDLLELGSAPRADREAKGAARQALQGFAFERCVERDVPGERRDRLSRSLPARL